jgi:hypothetical protein
LEHRAKPPRAWSSLCALILQAWLRSRERTLWGSSRPTALGCGDEATAAQHLTTGTASNDRLGNEQWGGLVRYYADAPQGDPNWGFQFRVALIFPK